MDGRFLCCHFCTSLQEQKDYPYVCLSIPVNKPSLRAQGEQNFTYDTKFLKQNEQKECLCHLCTCRYRKRDHPNKRVCSL